MFLIRSTASVVELVAGVERSAAAAAGPGGLLLFVLFDVIRGGDGGGGGVPLLEKRRRRHRGRSVVRVSPEVRRGVVVRRGAGLSVELL